KTKKPYKMTFLKCLSYRVQFTWGHPFLVVLMRQLVADVLNLVVPTHKLVAHRQYMVSLSH
ncbi:hypothetical protein, partial [Bacillus sp. FJAT-22090]|uniref:hypothetical protein n=1 Tax=Bacillus sp. FJAT-22090 TaxID=1581038 RepID=UPI001C92C996